MTCTIACIYTTSTKGHTLTANTLVLLASDNNILDLVVLLLQSLFHVKSPGYKVLIYTGKYA